MLLLALWQHCGAVFGEVTALGGGAGKGSGEENHMLSGMLSFVVGEQWEARCQQHENGGGAGEVCRLAESIEAAIADMDILGNLSVELDWFFGCDAMFNSIVHLYWQT